MSILSQNETDALNRHGVFLKKRVLHLLSEIEGLSIVGEEIGVTYGEKRIIDILAFDHRAEPHVFFIFECKRAYASEKRWIFFRDIDPNFRVVRTVSSLMGNSSVFAKWEEFPSSANRADQNPIFMAACQLCTSYLGLVRRRSREFYQSSSSSPDVVERYIPVLVTTASLVVVQHDLSGVRLQTGNISDTPQISECNWLILKHSLPTPEALDGDFRDHPNPFPPSIYWPQLHRESIYVVNAASLEQFLPFANRELNSASH